MLMPLDLKHQAMDKLTTMRVSSNQSLNYHIELKRDMTILRNINKYKDNADRVFKRGKYKPPTNLVNDKV